MGLPYYKNAFVPKVCQGHSFYFLVSEMEKELMEHLNVIQFKTDEAAPTVLPDISKTDFFR